MKSKLSAVLFSAFIAISSISYAGNANAQGRATGPLTEIIVAPDRKSAVAVVTDRRTNVSHRITITDEATLGRINDKVINVGDEIIARFGNDPQKTSQSFRRAAGC